MKILYAASEALPFMASGGLADVAGSLPRALSQKGAQCRVIMPMYGDIKPEMKSKIKYVKSFNVHLSWRNQYCGLFQAEHEGTIYYFLDNEYYFKRHGLYGFYDDAERFAFFSRAVCEAIGHLDFIPDVIHCNDWQTALIPVYLNCYYRNQEKTKNIKTVLTIHNIQYQGKYGMDIADDVLGLPQYAREWVEYDACLNMMKGGIEQSDMVTTVSPTYAVEIMDPWFGHGLDRILRDRSYKLTGVLNGIDVDLYNAKTDPFIFHNFTPDTLEKKAENKAELQKLMGLEQKPDTMLLCIISRLVSHKGIDLIKYIFDDIMQGDVQVAVLGSGDYIYENFLREMQEKYPGRVAVEIGFIPELSHKIYAGSDVLLMPSKSEPCGLAQMIALRYGTIPVVRSTGGLQDSITDMNDVGGNGFTFQSYNAHDMLGAISRCSELYSDRAKWLSAVKIAMQSDFSWSKSADKYIQMYKRLVIS